MAFRLFTDKAGNYTEYGDEDRYRIQDNGVLELTKTDGVTRYYSPMGWHAVEERR